MLPVRIRQSVVAHFGRTRRVSTRAVTSARIYESTSLDPYFNLALEDWLFRAADVDSAVLLFYRNAPSVIVGRNQNPWKEINFPALRDAGIPFVRRRSGGGTVYHDEGNTNYSIAIPRTNFDRRTNAELVARGIATLGVPATVNERNDVTVQDFKMTYKIVNKRAYHHGTMLISAQLKSLGDLLRNKKDTMIIKGVDSVRSTVRNLQDFSPDVTHDRFVSAVAKEFADYYGGDGSIQRISEVDYAGNEVVGKGQAELKSWEWSHGQTPEFTHDLTKQFEWGTLNVHIKAHKGLITEFTVLPQFNSFNNASTSSEDQDQDREILLADCEHFSDRAIGLKYGLPDSARDDEIEVYDLVRRDMWEEVVEWLREEM